MFKLEQYKKLVASIVAVTALVSVGQAKETDSTAYNGLWNAKKISVVVFITL